MPRWLLLVCAASQGCTGDAFLGFVPVTTPMLVDASASSMPVPPDAAADGPDAMATPEAGSAVANAPLLLQVRRDGSAITQLQLQCPERCAQLELAANGGAPPYVFGWEDGANTASRIVCPSTSVAMTVSVRDALGQTLTLELPVQLEACKAEALCLTNPSFEGAATLGAEWLGTAALSAAGWEDCRSTQASGVRSLPRVVTAASGDEFPAATDGNSYLYLPTHEGRQGFVGQTLCAPLERGSLYYLKLDLAYAAEDSAGVPLEPGQLEIYGADDACSRSELLWASPPLHTALRTFCIALQPDARRVGLVISPTGVPGKDSAVFVDHLQPVSSCP